MSRHVPPCVCRKCGLDHAAPANPAWRYSPPVSGWIRVPVVDKAGQVTGERRVHVVEVDAYVVRDLLQVPIP